MNPFTDFLAQKNVSVWPSGTWDLTDPQERVFAAQWMAHLMDDFHFFMETWEPYESQA